MSTGPAADLADLEVDAPASAAAGSQVAVRVSVHVRREGPRVVTTRARSELLVTRDGQVVASSTTPSADAVATVPLPLRAGSVRPGQVVPDTVRLVGCAPGASGPLPPGRYGLVAVLGYGGDPLNTAADGAAGSATGFQLVSRPAWIEVT